MTSHSYDEQLSYLKLLVEGNKQLASSMTGEERAFADGHTRMLLSLTESVKQAREHVDFKLALHNHSAFIAMDLAGGKRDYTCAITYTHDGNGGIVIRDIHYPLQPSKEKQT